MPGAKANSFPPEIYEACSLLGITVSELEESTIRLQWRRSASEHARLGNFHAARELMHAKATLIGWLRSKHMWFTPESPRVRSGCSTKSNDGFWPPPPKGPDNTAPVPRPYSPTAGAGEIALPLPDPEESIEMD